MHYALQHFTLQFVCLHLFFQISQVLLILTKKDSSIEEDPSRVAKNVAGFKIILIFRLNKH